ncbi:hypothetical protein [Goekera deserti]|nr:hypothetical protein [Goekera deserti]
MDEKELEALELDDAELSTVYGGMEAQARCAEAAYEEAMVM